MKYIVLVYICVIDINKKIIPEKGFLTLMIIGLLKSLINNNIAGYYLGICAFSMPLLILYIAEDYVKKELIGFGDIKLMMALGGIFTYKTLEEIIRFYMLLYILSGIFTIFLIFYLKIKKKIYSFFSIYSHNICNIRLFGKRIIFNMCILE